MNEHHHLELLTIDYDMLDILSVPYSSPIVINGKWRVPVTKKLIYDARCKISNQGKSIVNSCYEKSNTTVSTQRQYHIVLQLSGDMWG